MAAQQPRRKRIDVLKEKLAASSGTLADLQSIASSLNLMEARYMARPAAELLVETGDAAASQIANGLAATPVLGRDPSGDLLRAAFKKALANEGIPRDVDEMARRFYGARGHAVPKSQPTAPQKGVIRRLFGGRG
jgi:hypothetical protein